METIEQSQNTSDLFIISSNYHMKINYDYCLRSTVQKSIAKIQIDFNLHIWILADLSISERNFEFIEGMWRIP